MTKFNGKFSEDVVKEVRKDFERRRQERKPLELQWRLNMNFYSGNQYAEITPVGDVEQYGKQYYWQEREVYNHIASIIETRLSKLNRLKCAISVRPFSNDDSDVQTAKLSTQIIKALCEENDLPRLLNEASSWSEVTGSCFFKTVWAGEKGRGTGQPKTGAVREGDVYISVVPPYEIFPDNIGTSNLDDCMSIIHAKAYHVDEIKDIWGVDVNGEDVNVFSLDGAQVGAGLGFDGAPNVLDGVAHDMCVVIEKYSRPTADKPNGELSIVAGDKLLYHGDLPYINAVNGGRSYPFTKIICLEKLGCFYGTSIIERLIPLQRAYNAVKNRKHEFINRLSMGVLSIEDGSVDTDNLEEEGLSPGKVLIYRQGSTPPKLLESGRVPVDFQYEEERILSEFTTISGVSELSKYSNVLNQMSGKAIGMLVEQDDTRLSIATTSLRMGIKRICEQMLRLYRQFCQTKRMKRFSGDNGEVELAYFTASDLQSDDLVFDNENELTDTLENKRNMVIELVRMGIFNDENGAISNRNKLKILEILGFGNWESSRDIDESHRKKAMKENLDFGKEDVKVAEYDDHGLHIDEHLKRLLEEKDERLIALIDEHIRQHRMMKTIDMANAPDDGGQNENSIIPTN
ncbi:MAG: hypothetical protein K2O31_04480 [Clostridia bacterium]|nr:hypothetical protein [Clostridia bacterium]